MSRPLTAKLPLLLVATFCLSNCAAVAVLAPGAVEPFVPPSDRYDIRIGSKSFLVRPAELQKCNLTRAQANANSVRCAQILDGKTPLTKARAYPAIVAKIMARNPNMTPPPAGLARVVADRRGTPGGAVKLFGVYFAYVSTASLKATFEIKP